MKRVMVTPARLFEFPTTLTFGALRRNHIVLTVLETIAKKSQKKQKQGKFVVHVWSATYHELPRTQPKLERNVV